jgi:hypothetical protein
MTQPSQTPQIKIEQWSETFIDTQLYFQVYHLTDSFFIWMGDKQGKLKSMTVGLNTPYVMAVSTFCNPLEQFAYNDNSAGLWE